MPFLARTQQQPSPVLAARAEETTLPSTGSPTGSSLYLFTFLSTLVLLVCVSGVIVARAAILRRRYRNNPELRPATLAPRPVVSLSHKPTMWDAWLDGDSHSLDLDSMKPLSAILIYPTPPPPPPIPSDTSPPRNNGWASLWPRFRAALAANVREFVHETAPPRSLAAATQSPSAPPSPPSPRKVSELLLDAEKAQVTVLIAMPQPKPQRDSVSKREDEEANEVPDVVFGVREVGCDGLREREKTRASEDSD